MVLANYDTLYEHDDESKEPSSRAMIIGATVLPESVGRPRPVSRTHPLMVELAVRHSHIEPVDINLFTMHPLSQED
jgi:hypothetical protein